MVIIKTQVLRPTNSRGSRIKASANGFQAVIPYPYAKSDADAHYEAVKYLVKKNNLDWNIDDMRYGSDDKGYYFAFDCSKIISDKI